jgi:hypothetical protein
MSLDVNERARAIATFRHVEVRLMEITSTWTPTTPEMEAKVMFGKHIWDYAQHADWLGKRTFELRQPEHYTLPPSDAYKALIEQVAGVRTTPERIGAIYDFFLPAVLRRYEGYLSKTDQLLDAPSVVIIERILREHRRQVDEARELTRALKLRPAFNSDLIARESRVELIASR